ncbi:MAG: type II toxin-antitoxin system RelB/DinJ family antitoxin [Oscillospiraceae bacterium]|nr:type II toxin-antitoxin system RelB/DinJ family antitoxin [Oscillospiraceae bacterium]
MTQTTIRLDPSLKKEFAKTCDDMGLSISSAITIFAKAVVREQRIPFEVAVASRLNAVTVAAIKDSETGVGVKSFKTPEELFAELNSEDD